MSKEEQIQPGVTAFGAPVDEPPKPQQPVPVLDDPVGLFGPSVELSPEGLITQAIDNLTAAVRDLFTDMEEMHGLAEGQVNTDNRLDVLENAVSGQADVNIKIDAMDDDIESLGTDYKDLAQTVSRCCKELAKISPQLSRLRYRIHGIEDQLRAQRDHLAKHDENLDAMNRPKAALYGPQE